MDVARNSWPSLMEGSPDEDAAPGNVAAREGLDDDCPVCLSLLCEPVSLPECGHVFCRGCAFQALHVGTSACCPLCRTVTKLPADPSALPLQADIAESLVGRYPTDTLAARADAHKVELAAFVAALESRHELPFFVMRASLDVGDRCRIHLFEPRYRWLVDKVMADGTNRFAFVTSGQPEIGGAGIVCEIMHHTLCVDGSHDVVIRAEQPFVIQRVFLSDVPAQYSGARAVPPLLQGSVQFTEGPGPGQGIGAEPVPTLGRRAAMVAEILQAAISRGVPMWNAGDTAGCTALYRAVAERLADSEPRLAEALRCCEGRGNGSRYETQEHPPFV